MTQGSRVRQAFDGLGGYLGGATALAVFALLTFLVTIQSPSDMLLWTGGHAVGSENNGFTRYTVDGSRYTLASASSATRSRVDVYYKKSDPFTARLDSTPVRVIDASSTGVPLLLAVFVLGLGVRRRRRGRIASSAKDEAFGTGLDPDFVRRQLEERRRPPG